MDITIRPVRRQESWPRGKVMQPRFNYEGRMDIQTREPMERKKLYRISEVAGMFGIKPVTLRKWIRDGWVHYPRPLGRAQDHERRGRAGLFRDV